MRRMPKGDRVLILTFALGLISAGLMGAADRIKSRFIG
ncbi:hypothetical protein OP10G_3285 [Fimbriimonas ginsengisoli Gsoil 348]|uniref:Uncharacterized protein n=1 Tax=Fimbriimonas ginsengisoli Gsoil 348 TaxID=661478 RepID=A0A068NSZ6_FIMGI|nr:hypothetical protein OP10G_3285 [Fimbriimonas ginsengisoli Gsoil 348]